MTNTHSSSDISARIRELLEERDSHAAALSQIDDTLARIGSVLKPNGRGPKSAAATVRAPAKVGAPRGRRKRAKFAVTADESVLAFIQKHNNPTNRDIQAQWESEGRGGAAANTLSRLVKDKKLVRQPLDGQRGSRYLLS